MKYLPFAFFAALILLSCGKNRVTIVLPAEESLVLPYGVHFVWTGGDKTCRVQASHHENFETLLLDTNVSGSHLVYDQSFTFDSVVYWKVISNGRTTESKFFTGNYTDLITGSYPVEVHEFSYGSAQFFDTTYADMVSIVKTGKRTINVSLAAQNLNRDMGFWYGEQNGYVTYASSVPYSQAAYLSFSPAEDSIKLQFSNGGLGGGRRWACRFKK